MPTLRNEADRKALVERLARVTPESKANRWAPSIASEGIQDSDVTFPSCRVGVSVVIEQASTSQRAFASVLTGMRRCT